MFADAHVTAAEANATATLLAVDDADCTGGRGDAEPSDTDRDIDFYRTLETLDEEERELQLRLETHRRYEFQMRADEYEGLQKVYQARIKRSIRAMRRMPCEPPPGTAMETEESEEAASGLLQHHLGLGYGLQYDDEVYNEHNVGVSDHYEELPSRTSPSLPCGDAVVPRPPQTISGTGTSRLASRVRRAVASRRAKALVVDDDFGE